MAERERERRGRQRKEEGEYRYLLLILSPSLALDQERKLVMTESGGRKKGEEKSHRRRDVPGRGLRQMMMRLVNLWRKQREGRGCSSPKLLYPHRRARMKRNLLRYDVFDCYIYILLLHFNKMLFSKVSACL